MAKQYFDPDEVASRLKLNVETIRRYLRSRKMRGIKVSPKCWRIEDVEVQRFMDKNHG